MKKESGKYEAPTIPPLPRSCIMHIIFFIGITLTFVFTCFAWIRSTSPYAAPNDGIGLFVAAMLFMVLSLIAGVITLIWGIS